MLVLLEQARWKLEEPERRVKIGELIALLRQIAADRDPESSLARRNGL